MCDDCMGMLIQAKAAQKEAEEQLAKHTPLEYKPDFHSYYWIGWMDAVKAMKKCPATRDGVSCDLEAGHPSPHVHHYAMQDWSWR